jgi:hypothetical protein
MYSLVFSKQFAASEINSCALLQEGGSWTCWFGFVDGKEWVKKQMYICLSWYSHYQAPSLLVRHAIFCGLWTKVALMISTSNYSYSMLRGLLNFWFNTMWGFFLAKGYCRLTCEMIEPIIWWIHCFSLYSYSIAHDFFFIESLYACTGVNVIL